VTLTRLLPINDLLPLRLLVSRVCENETGPSIERESQKRLWLSIVLIATAGWPILFMAFFPAFPKWAVFPASAKFLAWQGYYEGVTILIGVVCDFLFIALTRVMLARAAESNSFIKIAGLAVGNACLATLLFIAPLVGSFQLALSPPAWLAANTLYLVGASNFLDALVSLTWFLIAILMLFHRLFWPLIERPVYALFRHRIFSEQKKLVFLSGVALLGLAVPSVGRTLETLVKAVHS
jgi:hypothetical protein